MKVAIVYDRVNKWGGAESVLLSIHEIFPDAYLYTSVYEPSKALWAKVFPKVVTSFLEKFPWARKNHEYLAPLMPFAFESFDFDSYDLVISVTSEAAKGIITKPKTLHICYLLTPTRYLWSAYDIYFKNPIIRFFGFPFVKLLKNWDIFAAQRPDVLVAISSEVKKRINKYYSRESEIVFPPVDIVSDKSLLGNNKLPKEDYYLIVSRLVSYKRVDLAIKAFNKIGKNLIVIGKGSEEKKLKRISGKNIRFLGEISKENLVDCYKKAKALIMPQEEDFGIVSVEAQFLGTPVIAFKKGGSLDTVIPGKTGIFFEKQEVESLVKAIEKFEKMNFSEQDLIHNARKFSKEFFKKRLLSIINENGKKL